MSSANDDSSMPGRTLRLTASQFEMIFQVTKELRSLPRAELERIGWEDPDIDHMLSILRAFRGRVEGVSFVRIQLSEAPENEDYPSLSRIISAGCGQASVKDISAVLPHRLGREWRHIVESIVSNLGARELFLRTGYDVDEVFEVTRRFSVDAH